MSRSLGHLQYNVPAASLPFYHDLFSALGWSVLHHDEGAMLGIGADPEGAQSIWFAAMAEDAAMGAPNGSDGIGLNHVGIGVSSMAEVDAAAATLRERDVSLLFETPRHRPEFTWEEGQTYYQVMFASPDQILFEIVYTGPKG